MTDVARVYLHEEPRALRFIETKNEIVVTRKWRRETERRNEEFLLIGKFFILQDESILKSIQQ